MDAAGLMGVASQYKNGLMPMDYARYNTSGGALDLNECKGLWRHYSTVNAINAPTTGYIGFFNIGYNTDWFIQIACVVQTGGGYSIWRRCYHTGETWSTWNKIA